MAGMLVSLFSSSTDSFLKCAKSFKRNRFLQPSFELRQEAVNIVKYRRRSDSGDANCHVEGNLTLMCIGTLIYEGHPLDSSLMNIAKELLKGTAVEKVCSRLDGSFCLLILDNDSQVVHIVTDVAGLLHCYYYQNGDIHIISTSEVAMARCLPVTPAIMSMAQFIRVSYILDDDTLFNEIRLLEPSSHYCFDLSAQKVARRKYYNLPTEINWSMSFDEATESLSQTMDRIIRLFPKEETLVDFTGGNDSRSIMSYVYGNGQHKNAISALFTGPPESYEYKLIKQTCSDLGVKFHDFLPNVEFDNQFTEYVLSSHELGSGEENAPFHAPILWSNEHKGKAGFCFSMHGSGGELYRDARWDQEFGKRGRPIPADLNRLIRWRVFQYEYDYTIFSKEFVSIIQQVPDRFLTSYKNTVSAIDPKKGTNTLQLDTIYLLQNMRKWGGATVSSTNQIIPSVCPFLFRGPLDIALSVNPHFKKGCRLNKAIAERLAPELAKSKMQTGSPYLVWRLDRLYLFLPFYFFLLKKLIRKISQRVFRRTVFSKVTVHDFDLLPRFRRFLEDPVTTELLNYDRMQTRHLFDRNALAGFLNLATQPGFKHYKTLGNIITLELTMRQACLNKPIEFIE